LRIASKSAGENEKKKRKSCELTENAIYSYYVCEKSDGIRYLLYSTRDPGGSEAHFLIDRKNNYWYIPGANLHFPTAHDEKSFHVDTLIDGELVMDDLGTDALGGEHKEARFLVFDCLVLDGNADLRSRPLDKRLGYFQEHIMKPYKNLLRKYPDEQKYQAFKVEMKQMQFSYAIETMFRDILPNLKHGNDGLVFTCRTTEYRHGTDEHILKWKPVEENTIDFRLSLRFPTVTPDEADLRAGLTEPYVDYDSVPEADLEVFHGRNVPEPYKFYAKLYLTPEEWQTLKDVGDPLMHRIVECGLDAEGRWRLHRFRDDKDDANFITTVNSVLESINQAVSKEELLAAAMSIREQHKLRNSRQQPQK
jgi:mRNA guanylyltransferase